jgi:hypothetical protein
MTQEGETGKQVKGDVETGQTVSNCCRPCESDNPPSYCDSDDECESANPPSWCDIGCKLSASELDADTLLSEASQGELETFISTLEEHGGDFSLEV